MVIRVEVAPRMLRWARERAGLTQEALTRRFPKLPLWEAGERQPTLKQLQAFAAATHAPVGYLFLDQPPVEEVPIPDLRTIAGLPIARPSPDLLDMLYVCQQRQEWYREWANSAGEDPLGFVGSASIDMPIDVVARRIRGAIGFTLENQRRCPTWTDALRELIACADAAGVMVMCSGVVLNDTHRPLDPAEFRGFALSDEMAPLVFVNGADTKAAQIFTLAHELAHIWLGQTALSDAGALQVPDLEVERWCNRVAAEFLVPIAELRAELRSDSEVEHEMRRLAARFKVSTLVILRRLHDVGRIGRDEMWHRYQVELARLSQTPRRSGGHFYLTQAARVSRRFASALVVDTLEGQTLYRDAMRMLGIRKIDTLHGLAHSLGVAV